MHFQEIKDTYYHQIPQKIKEFIPEFTSIFGEEDGIYPILGDLGSFLIDNIKNSKILDKIMVFVNDAFVNGKTDTENAIVLQIFDKFYEEYGDISEIENYLSLDSKIKLKKYFPDMK